jgi:hypothetical protein
MPLVGVPVAQAAKRSGQYPRACRHWHGTPSRTSLRWESIPRSLIAGSTPNLCVGPLGPKLLMLSPGALPDPDPRWRNFAGGVSGAGNARLIHYSDLEGIASDWVELINPSFTDRGASRLLATARSVFALSYFNYDLMAVAALLAFQAVEAAFRELYADAANVPWKGLVNRAQRDGVVPDNIAEVALSGTELRNLLSHPLTQASFTSGMAAGMLEQSHRLAGLILMRATGVGRSNDVDRSN